MTTKKYLSYFFLFDKIDFVKKGISRHLAKIFESGELDEEMIVAKIAITTQHGAMQDKTAFGKTISVNCWKEFVPSVPANVEYGDR